MPNHGSPRLDLVRAAELLLAGAAVIGASTFAGLNALYIEFYDDFGLRPEEVGLDRLAVLGRTAWIAFLVLVAVVTIPSLVALLAAAGRHDHPRTHGPDAASEDDDEERPSNRRDHRPALALLALGGLSLLVGFVIDDNRTASFFLAPAMAVGAIVVVNVAFSSAIQSRRRAEVSTFDWLLVFVVPLALAGLLLFLGGFALLRNHVEDLAASVRKGHTVGGVGWVVPLIDVRAYASEATWVGDPKRRPKVLDAPHFTYLGRSTDTLALLACGRNTLILRPADVVVEVIRGAHGVKDVDRDVDVLPEAC